MIVITGASGMLGQLILKELLKSVPANELVAAVRSPQKVADFASLGVQVRQIDYDRPDTLEAAFTDAEKVLLISGSEVGSRVPQHANVINACKKNADVKLLAYTSLLHADSSPLPLAAEHQQTEILLQESGLPHVILRHGWYTENYTAAIAAALEYGVLMGCAGEGKIASATRADYAAAAAVLLTSDRTDNVYELAGDEAYTLSEFAAELSRQSGKTVQYQNLSQDDYSRALQNAGLPQPIALMLAESDTGASKGGLFDDSKTLSQLIGRPSTPLSESIKAALTT
jgi:NAD(P)H dehydrogenase (quinone)